MRQASNSPLTLYPFSIRKRPSVRALPRAFDWAVGLLLTPFRFRQRVFPGYSGAVLDMPYPPRSWFRSRLGEGSVRRLFTSTFVLMTVISALLPQPAARASDSVGWNSGALERAVKAHIMETSCWKDAEIEVRSTANLSGAELPPGDLSFRVVAKNPPANYGSLLLPVEASMEGRTIRTFWITADVMIRARVAQAANRLPFGRTIAAGDVREAVVEIKDPRAQYLRSSAEAAGMIMRRTLSSGDPLTRECITRPFLVRTGQTVRLKLKYGSVSLAALARAEQSGRLGQVIRIRNMDFSRPVRAEVTGPGEVTIE